MEQNNTFTRIRVVGFDLDQTLYPKSPLIDERIQEYLYEKIAEYRTVTRAEAIVLFKERYQGGAGMSGSETIADLGLANPSELIQEALEYADIASVLTPDRETNHLLSDVRKAYGNMDLITGSNLDQTKKKLAALQIPLELFSHIISADDSKKSTGNSYRAWLALYPHLVPSQFLYIGDRTRSDHEVPSALGIRTALVYIRQPDPALSAIQLPDISGLRTLLFPT